MPTKLELCCIWKGYRQIFAKIVCLSVAWMLLLGHILKSNISFCNQFKLFKKTILRMIMKPNRRQYNREFIYQISILLKLIKGLGG